MALRKSAEAVSLSGKGLLANIIADDPVRWQREVSYR